LTHSIRPFNLQIPTFPKSFQGSEQNEQNRERERLAYEASINRITLSCKQLEQAKSNVNALAFFSRKPNEEEGYERMWVSAIDQACVRNLVGVFRDYGVEFAHNFGEWEDQSPVDAYRSIEDIAAYKARAVYKVTGLPCISSATSFEVEPIKSSGQSASSRFGGLNPKVATGYKFNKIGDHVDLLVDALIPASDPCRITTFKSVLCFYDGKDQIFDYGECDVDLILSNSIRAFIPMSLAIKEMCESLQLAYNLEYQVWLKKKVRAVLGSIGNASLKLRDRVLKEAKVLPNDIIDVSSFMDSKVDVNLMEECADELVSTGLMLF